jgi:predicted nucleotidyltransferase/AraC-like DNA-binding protein
MSQRPIDLLLSRIGQQVLGVLLMHPDRWWYRSELARRLGTPPSSLQKALASLLGSGLLRSRRDGNRLYYQANPEAPLYPEIRIMVAKTVGLVDVVREALAPLSRQITVAFIHGSIARAEESSTSDVDLMIVGTTGLSDLSPALRAAAARLGREVNPTVFSEAELHRKLAARHHFVTSVLDSPKLFVVGTEDDLARVAGPRKRREKEAGKD